MADDKAEAKPWPEIGVSGRYGGTTKKKLVGYAAVWSCPYCDACATVTMDSSDEAVRKAKEGRQAHWWSEHRDTEDTPDPSQA